MTVNATVLAGAGDSAIAGYAIYRVDIALLLL
jgi:hypothetical protein